MPNGGTKLKAPSVEAKVSKTNVEWPDPGVQDLGSVVPTAGLRAS